MDPTLNDAELDWDALDRIERQASRRRENLSMSLADGVSSENPLPGGEGVSSTPTGRTGEGGDGALPPARLPMALATAPPAALALGPPRPPPPRTASSRPLATPKSLLAAIQHFRRAKLPALVAVETSRTCHGVYARGCPGKLAHVLTLSDGRLLWRCSEQGCVVTLTTRAPRDHPEVALRVTQGGQEVTLGAAEGGEDALRAVGGPRALLEAAAALDPASARLLALAREIGGAGEDGRGGVKGRRGRAGGAGASEGGRGGGGAAEQGEARVEEGAGDAGQRGPDLRAGRGDSRGGNAAEVPAATATGEVGRLEGETAQVTRREGAGVADGAPSSPPRPRIGEDRTVAFAPNPPGRVDRAAAALVLAPLEPAPDPSPTTLAFPLKLLPELTAVLHALGRRLGLPGLLPAHEGVPGPTAAAAGGLIARRASEADACAALGAVPPAVARCLLPFQREGVAAAAARGGRLLLADEMGVGKSAQALAIAAAYAAEWPALFVVPAALRLHWAEELERWLPDLDPCDVRIIAASADRVRAGTVPKITVTSYEMLARLSCEACRVGRGYGREPGGAEGEVGGVCGERGGSGANLGGDSDDGGSRPGSCSSAASDRPSPTPSCSSPGCMLALGWRVVVLDESHVLHTCGRAPDAVVTECAARAARGARRAVLLSGTPSLSRPFGLFRQVDALRPGLLGPDRDAYARAYCDRRLVPAMRRASGVSWGGGVGVERVVGLRGSSGGPTVGSLKDKEGSSARGGGATSPAPAPWPTTTPSGPFAPQARLRVDVSGLSRGDELHGLLRRHVMVRRRKRDLLTQLLPLTRQVIRLPASRGWRDRGAGGQDEGVGDGRDGEDGGREDEAPRGSTGPSSLLSAHTRASRKRSASGGPHADAAVEATTEPMRVGLSKVDAAVEWLSHFLRPQPDAVDPPKVAVFAHHRAVMARLASGLRMGLRRVSKGWEGEVVGSEGDCDDRGVDEAAQRPVASAPPTLSAPPPPTSLALRGFPFVQVDGSSSPEERRDAVLSFRHDPKVRVALLSITAAGVGLDFSTASSVLFVELPGEVGLLRQAEDRVHRRGQQRAVNSVFLCAKGTSDERRWQGLSRSLARLSLVHDGGVGGEEERDGGGGEGSDAEGGGKDGQRRWEGGEVEGEGAGTARAGAAAEGAISGGDGGAGERAVDGNLDGTEGERSAGLEGERVGARRLGGGKSDDRGLSDRLMVVDSVREASQRGVVGSPSPSKSGPGVAARRMPSQGALPGPSPLRYPTPSSPESSQSGDRGDVPLPWKMAGRPPPRPPLPVFFLVSPNTRRVHFHWAEDGSHPWGFSVPLELICTDLVPGADLGLLEAAVLPVLRRGRGAVASRDGTPAIAAPPPTAKDAQPRAPPPTPVPSASPCSDEWAASWFEARVAALEATSLPCAFVPGVGLVAPREGVTPALLRSALVLSRDFAGEWRELRPSTRLTLTGRILPPRLADVAADIEEADRRRLAAGTTMRRHAARGVARAEGERVREARVGGECGEGGVGDGPENPLRTETAGSPEARVPGVAPPLVPPSPGAGIRPARPAPSVPAGAGCAGSPAAPAETTVRTVLVRWPGLFNPCRTRQAFDSLDRRLCVSCGAAVPAFENVPPEQVLEGDAGLFCSPPCETRTRIATSGGAARRALYAAERGICALCGLDCAELLRAIRAIERGSPGWRALRREAILERAPEAWREPSAASRVARLAERAADGNAWHADHVVAVYLGGGSCDLSNLRTLCVVCHAGVTRRQAADRAATRREARAAAAAASGGARVGAKKRAATGAEGADAREAAKKRAATGARARGVAGRGAGGAGVGTAGEGEAEDETERRAPRRRAGESGAGESGGFRGRDGPGRAALAEVGQAPRDPVRPFAAFAMGAPHSANSEAVLAPLRRGARPALRRGPAAGRHPIAPVPLSPVSPGNDTDFLPVRRRQARSEGAGHARDGAASSGVRAGTRAAPVGAPSSLGAARPARVRGLRPAPGGAPGDGRAGARAPTRHGPDPARAPRPAASPPATWVPSSGTPSSSAA